MYKLTVRANQDLEEAYEYLFKINPDAALKLLNALDERCISLSEFPGQGRPRNDLRDGMRSVAEHSYTIFYRAKEYGILVIRMLHHTQDADQYFTTDSLSEEVVAE